MDDMLKKMKVLKYGYYTLFENEYGRRILMLDREEWFVWINDDLGPTLIYAETMGTLGYKIIMEGRYFLENLENDPLMPHLFLQDDEVYMEIILPQGLPSEIDNSKLMMITDHLYPREYLENRNEEIIPGK